MRFVQRAQRVGFSLGDIRIMLAGLETNSLSDESVLRIAESRLLELESHLTELLVLRREMALLLSEFKDRIAGKFTGPLESLPDRLLNHICSLPSEKLAADEILQWLFERTNCSLGTGEGKELINSLRGQHFHIWQEGAAYHILVVSKDPSIRSSLQQLARLEAGCQLHSPPSLAEHEQGHLMVLSGENAFLYARLFLALEQE